MKFYLVLALLLWLGQTKAQEVYDDDMVIVEGMQIFSFKKIFFLCFFSLELSFFFCMNMVMVKLHSTESLLNIMGVKQNNSKSYYYFFYLGF